jgi:HYDIN/CFA65/VesB family protein
MRVTSIKRSSALGIVIVMMAACSGLAHAQWTKIGDGSGNAGTAPGAGPAAATTCLLLTDGSAMCQEYSNPLGGSVDSTHWWRLSPDNLGHYETGTWSKLQAASAGYGPLYYCSAVLADGRVVVIGGENNLGASAETTLGYIFDPTQNGGAGQWSSTPISLGTTGWTKIGDSICAILSDKTLVIGDGDNSPSPSNQQMARLDLSTQTLVLVNSPALENSKADGNGEEGWTLLPDGTILTVDTGTQGGTGSEIYTPNANQTSNPNANQTWASAGSTQVSMPNNGGQSIGPEMGPQILRPDGTVIAFGATQNTSVYSTATQKWTAGPSFSTVSAVDECGDAPASLLPSGNVLVAASGFFVSPTHFYEFDGTNLNLVNPPPGASSQPSFNTRLLLLPTGQVLYTDGTGDVELYTPGGTFQDSWRPTITAGPNSMDPGNTYSISGTQFNGLSQANAYGDDATNATNYPLVRITNQGTGHVFYARTHDHSTMGVATGSAVVSTNFDTPSDPEIAGLSDLEIVANGIPSKKFVINGPGLSIPGPLSMSSCQGSPTTATLNVCNTGKANLNINSITSSDPQFSVSNPGFTLVVSPDFCFPFQVNYTPNGTATANASLTIASNDPNNPSEVVQVTGTPLEPSINAVVGSGGNFPNTCSGSQSSQSIQITNQGACNLTINSITTNNPVFSGPTISTPPLTLSADATVSLPITFSPTSCSAGAVTGTVTIASNDPLKPFLTESVSGLVPCPNISATIANSGSFGNVCAGNQGSSNLEVLNTGQCNLTIKSISSTNPEFVPPAVQSFPLVLSADANVDMPISFSPVGACGPQASTITIVSDDPNHSTLVQPVSGLEGCPKMVLSPQNLTGPYAYPATVSDPTGNLGCFTDRQIAVSNSGICPLNITGLSTANGTDGIGAALPTSPLEFKVVNPTLPISIGPGAGPVPITVRFKPVILTDQFSMAPDQQTGTLLITSNDPVASDNSAGLCGEPTFHSGARVLVVNAAGTPISPVKSLSLSSKGLHPVVSESLSSAPLVSANVCGNIINYQLDNETLPPAGTTGSNPKASYDVSAKQGPTQASMSFTVGQCQMQQMVLQIK